MGAVAQVTRSMGPTGAWVAWADAERTENIHRMSVKLEVLKLSGWLNTDQKPAGEHAGVVCVEQ